MKVQKGGQPVTTRHACGQVRTDNAVTPAGRSGPRYGWNSRPPNADEPTPTDPNAFSFLTMTTRPSFRAPVEAEFKAFDGGKTAVYMTRWVNRTGAIGPWSETAVRRWRLRPPVVRTSDRPRSRFGDRPTTP